MEVSNNNSSSHGATTTRTTRFGFSFLDATRESLQQALGDDIPLDTAEGMALSRDIQKTRAQLGLDDTIGCSPKHYRRDRDVADPHSLWRLYLQHVVPVTVTKHNRSRVFVQSTGGLRYDLFEGQASRDDLIAVSPFNDTIYKVCEGLKGTELYSILNILNDEGFSVVPSLPAFLSTADLVEPPGALFLEDANRRFDLFGIDFDVSTVVAAAKRVRPNHPCQPVEMCEDGDDHNDISGGTSVCVNSNRMWTSYVAQDTSCSSCTINHCLHNATTPAQTASSPVMVARERKLSRNAGSHFYYLLPYVLVVAGVYRTLRRRHSDGGQSSLVPSESVTIAFTNGHSYSSIQDF